MTDALQTAIIVGLPPTILAVATLIRSLKNARIAEVNDKKTDKLIVKAEEIHELTNSAKSAVDENLKQANDQIADLNKRLGALVEQLSEKKSKK